MPALTIPQNLIERLLDHCRSAIPNEACGMLAGSDGVVRHLYEIKNVEPSPVSYLMDPREQFNIMKDMRQKGARLIAIYHSHPQSPAYPSAKDIGLAFYDDAVYIIVSLIDIEQPEVRGYRIVEGNVREVALIQEGASSGAL